MASDELPSQGLHGNEADKSVNAPGRVTRRKRRLERRQAMPGERRSAPPERLEARRAAREQQKVEKRRAKAEAEREARRAAREQQKVEKRRAALEAQREARRAAREQQKVEKRRAKAEAEREARRATREQQKVEKRRAALEAQRAARRGEREQRKAEQRRAAAEAERARRRADREQRKAEEKRAVAEAERVRRRAERKQRKTEAMQQAAEVRHQERHAERRQRRLEEARRERQRQRSMIRRQTARQDWRWSDGGLTFFNLNRDRQRLPAVDVRPLEAEEIPAALVSRLRDTALPPGAFSGAVYDRDGHIVPEFLEHDALTRHRVNRSINAPTIEQARIAKADRVYDTCIYLGRWSGHFGHFLLDTLARSWYLRKADRSALLLFQQWDDRLSIPPFASAFLKALNVQPARIRIVAGRDLRVRKLILPSMQFWQGVKASPGMCDVFDHMRERMLLSRTDKGRTPEKVYLSRRGLTGSLAKPAIVNEEEAESFFRRAGYQIIRPELLPVEEQVAIVANATHVAGPSGAALHLMMFNASRQAKLIELRTKPAYNQLLISAIRGSQAFHISCRKEGEPSDTAILEMDVVERAVREIG